MLVQSALSDKTRAAWITGASSGFGEAVALKLAATGKPLVLLARRKDRLDAVSAAVGRLGGTTHVVVADVADRAGLEAALARVPAAFASPDVLINSAGGARGIEPAQRASLEDWDWMIDANVKGLVAATKFALDRMIASEGGPRGHIVNMGSVAGEYPYAGGNVYGATKAFVRQFSLNLRADLLGTSIRVTDIEPGMAETEFSVARLGDALRAKGVYQGMQPLSAADVADNVMYCLGLPWHVNVNRLEVMPTAQAFAGFSVNRDNP